MLFGIGLLLVMFFWRQELWTWRLAVFGAILGSSAHFISVVLHLVTRGHLRRARPAAKFASMTVDIVAGYVDVVPGSGSFAPFAYAILNFTGNGQLSATVPAVEPASVFRMYVETSGTFPEDLAATPAISLVNSSDVPATVNLSLTNFDGTDSGLTGVINLPPRGHVGTFLTNIPGFETMPSPYAGVLKATTSNSNVTFAGFRIRYNELRQFMMTVTGPLYDVGDDNPVIFPHLVDGGGYATQFVVLPGAGGGGGTGTIRFLNSSGEPLNVAIAPQ
jgi:hypothetical protein